MLPVVYTPTVGLGCQEFSHTFRKPRGLFLSFPQMEHIKRILANPRFDNVETIVVTDGERILGLGDQGAGGMGIPIGKLSLYTACGGLHPAATLPILLDVGTNNPQCLADPVYVAWRHERLRGASYDEFIEAFVSAVVERWPHVLLQWEDFARDNATRLLERYRDRLCTFNDDIQGTAAVTVGTLLSAVNVTGVPLRDQRIAVLGAGSAGIGISSLLLNAMVVDGVPEKDARSRFYLVDREGLLVEGMPRSVDFQKPFAQSRAALADWRLEQPNRIGLFDVICNVRPTVLIGYPASLAPSPSAWRGAWDTIDIRGCLSILINQIIPVGHQAARLPPFAAVCCGVSGAKTGHAHYYGICQYLQRQGVAGQHSHSPIDRRLTARHVHCFPRGGRKRPWLALIIPGPLETGGFNPPVIRREFNSSQPPLRGYEFPSLRLDG